MFHPPGRDIILAKTRVGLIYIAKREGVNRDGREGGQEDWGKGDQPTREVNSGWSALGFRRAIRGLTREKKSPPAWA